MNFSDSLSNEQLALVADTSVLISLRSSTYGKDIISVIPNKVIVPAQVQAELIRGREENLFLPELLRDGLVSIEDTDDEDEDLLFRLGLALSDGESATIAIAIKRGYLPIVDERKGRKEAKLLDHSLEPAFCLDLFRHPKVSGMLGEAVAIEALYLALRDSKMRIPDEEAVSVITLIGADKARECSSLPGYRRRFGLFPGTSI